MRVITQVWTSHDDSDQRLNLSHWPLRAEESLQLTLYYTNWLRYLQKFYLFPLPGGSHQLPLAVRPGVPDDSQRGDVGDEVPPAGHLRARPALPGAPQTGHVAQSPHQDRGDSSV